MGGISMISQRRKQVNAPATVNNNQSELWFKDGDQALIKSVATGHTDDTAMTYIKVYQYRYGNTFKTVLDSVFDAEKDDFVLPEGLSVDGIPEGNSPKQQFAFWAYVDEVFHNERRVESWEPVQGKSGKEMFKEVVNDFKVIKLGFGRGDIVFGQLEEIYEDEGSLDKSPIRIKRMGAGLDTTYHITSLARELEIPADKQAEIANLPSITQYCIDTWGVKAGTEAEQTADDLFS